MTTPDQTGQQAGDSREVAFSFGKLNGDWLIREAEVKDPPKAQ
jgi:hypothetical protein